MNPINASRIVILLLTVLPLGVAHSFLSTLGPTQPAATPYNTPNPYQSNYLPTQGNVNNAAGAVANQAAQAENYLIPSAANRPGLPSSSTTTPSTGAPSENPIGLPPELANPEAAMNAAGIKLPIGGPATKAPPSPPKIDANIKVGDTFSGGVVVWVDRSQSSPHGLVAAASDEPGTYTWLAANNACSGGGTSGWHLPTAQEVELVYQLINPEGQGASSSGINISSAGRYWTSSDYSRDVAWSYDFYHGTDEVNAEDNMLNVHCVMAF